MQKAILFFFVVTLLLSHISLEQFIISKKVNIAKLLPIPVVFAQDEGGDGGEGSGEGEGEGTETSESSAPAEGEPEAPAEGEPEAPTDPEQQSLDPNALSDVLDNPNDTISQTESGTIVDSNPENYSANVAAGNVVDVTEAPPDVEPGQSFLDNGSWTAVADFSSSQTPESGPVSGPAAPEGDPIDANNDGVPEGYDTNGDGNPDITWTPGGGPGGDSPGGPSGSGTSSPWGLLTANPNPCMLAIGAAYCKSTIAWTTGNAVNPKIYVDGTLFAAGVSGLEETGAWINVNPGNFVELRADNSALPLATLYIYAQSLEPPRVNLYLTKLEQGVSITKSNTDFPYLSVKQNEQLTISWDTFNIPPGLNACTAAIISTNPLPSSTLFLAWNGGKNNNGSQVLPPIRAIGTYTFNIICTSKLGDSVSADISLIISQLQKPFIQTTGGDVHTNEAISVPGI